MYFGACYYPEHWPEERWQYDADLMREAGFNIVRLGEFAWTKMEKSEGVFDFDWLDRAIGILAGSGMKIIIGTPTAAPPKWLIDKYPDICPVDSKGHVMGFGHRRYYCFNNETYHRYAKNIVEKMAEHYKDNKHVIAWQIDNEFGCGGTTRCYCDNCLKAFRLWLMEKYQTIDALNESYGTVFSNQTYGSWDEIILPGYCAFNIHNPGLLLDYKRFASDSAVRFQRLQASILKAGKPDWTITHNMMGGFDEIDYFELAKDLDIVSLDLYPNCTRAAQISPENPAIQLDATRGIKNSNYWIMEHQSGAPGSGVMFRTPKPGDLRRWTYQSIARGADGIVYFRFRTCLFGAEEYWHGILDHSGVPGRKYEEVRQVGLELKSFSGLVEDSTSGAEIAMVRSFDIAWTFEIQPHVPDYKYSRHFKNYYSFFYRSNIAVDIVSMDCDLSAYKLVIVPNLIMAPDSFVQKLYAYVNSGGSVLLDFRTGAKEWDNRMVPMVLPGRFRELLGIEIEDYGVLLKEEFAPVKYLKNNSSYKGTAWYDVISLKEAEALAVYTAGYYSGKAAVTRNRYGQGNAFYLGTEADAELTGKLLNDICTTLDIHPALGIDTPGIEVCRRVRNGHKYYFVINHQQNNGKIYLDKVYHDLLTGKSLAGEVEMQPNDVLVLAETMDRGC